MRLFAKVSTAPVTPAPLPLVASPQQDFAKRTHLFCDISFKINKKCLTRFNPLSVLDGAERHTGAVRCLAPPFDGRSAAAKPFRPEAGSLPGANPARHSMHRPHRIDPGLQGNHPVKPRLVGRNRSGYSRMSAQPDRPVRTTETGVVSMEYNSRVCEEVLR